jgi:hypothetical protein
MTPGIHFFETIHFDPTVAHLGRCHTCASEKAFRVSRQQQQSQRDSLLLTLYRDWTCPNAREIIRGFIPRQGLERKRVLRIVVGKGSR